jgi:hypothetical protein
MTTRAAFMWARREMLKLWDEYVRTNGVID